MQWNYIKQTYHTYENTHQFASSIIDVWMYMLDIHGYPYMDIHSFFLDHHFWTSISWCFRWPKPFSTPLGTSSLSISPSKSSSPSESSASKSLSSLSWDQTTMRLKSVRVGATVHENTIKGCVIPYIKIYLHEQWSKPLVHSFIGIPIMVINYKPCIDGKYNNPIYRKQSVFWSLLTCT